MTLLVSHITDFCTYFFFHTFILFSLSQPAHPLVQPLALIPWHIQARVSRSEQDAAGQHSPEQVPVPGLVSTSELPRFCHQCHLLVSHLGTGLGMRQDGGGPYTQHCRQIKSWNGSQGNRITCNFSFHWSTETWKLRKRKKKILLSFTLFFHVLFHLEYQLGILSLPEPQTLQ